MRKSSLFSFAALFLARSAFALDSGDEEALRNTQALLNNPAALQEATRADTGARNAMAQVNQITNGNAGQNAEMNAISSSVFADMVKGNDGDAAAVQERLQNALKDPGAFIKTLSPEQQARLTGLAGQIERQNAIVRAPSATPAAK